MAEIQYIPGDASVPIGAGMKAIIHVVNDVGVWTKGFAESISKRWPEPEKQYKSWLRSRSNFELGKIQIVKVENDITVVNMLCQRGINFERKLDQHALEKCLASVAGYYAISEEKFTVHMPRICKGVVGANWYIIENSLKKILVEAGISVVVYNWVK